MGLSKAQESEMKNLAKEVVKEFLGDKTFMDTFADKILAAVTKKLNVDLDKIKKQISNLESTIITLQGENNTMKTQNEELKDELKNLKLLNGASDEYKYKLDDLEQNLKRNQLRIFGIPESQNNLKEEINNLFQTNLDIVGCEIESCFRVGLLNKKKRKPRSIIVKFAKTVDRDNVFYNKKKLKGKRISIVEELIKSRYELLQLAREKVGKTAVWTKEGSIYTNVEGEKYRVKCIKDVHKILDLEITPDA